MTPNRFAQAMLLATLALWGWRTAPALADDQEPPPKTPKAESRSQSPPGPSGFGVSSMGTPLSMIRREEVRNELKLTDEQSKQAVELTSRLWNEVSFPRREDLRSLTKEEQRQKFAEAMRKRNEFEKQLEKQLFALLDQSQAKRLRELGVQRRGLLALLDEEVSSQLALTDDQKRAIRAAFKSQYERFVAAPAPKTEEPKTLSPQERKTQFEDLAARAEVVRRETDKQILDTLTEEQRQKFEDLKGAKFEFRPFSTGSFPSSTRSGRSPKGTKPAPKEKK
jgi:Spy/CpxP family protein refolding chaperone